MPATARFSAIRPWLAPVLLWLIANPAWAALYKCQQPDGRVVYQQTACDGQATGDRLEVDIRGPDGTEAGQAAQDYSVTAQAERMRAEREALERERIQARREAEARARALRASAKPAANPDLDPAKCARHRSEAAKWKQKVMKGYHTPTEKEYNANKLAHHQALVARYCE